jgi:hypothetical protein
MFEEQIQDIQQILSISWTIFIIPISQDPADYGTTSLPR